MTIEAINYFETHYEQMISELTDFIAIPSVSTDPEHKENVQKAAEFIAAKLETIGLQHVQIFPTARHPIVYADYLQAGPTQPTILIYGHYDVQPEDPTDLWKTPPFTAQSIGDNLVARGASDMKGQIFACVSAVQALKSTTGLPVNIKFILEGEEEIGSPNFKQFLTEHKDLLKSDVALNTDAGMSRKDLPGITYGLRGLSYFELNLFGPDHDLHSGSYGGVVHNPAQVLADLISKMHDENGAVALPGFYDLVEPLSESERAELSKFSTSTDEYLAQTGVPALWGEKEFTPNERIGARPTLEVNGILSGFTGEGSKTIIPSRAMAKISTRLVPNQKPELVYEQLSAFLEENVPDTVRWELRLLSIGSPSLSDMNMPATKALSKAFIEVWGTSPSYKREGGSVPVVADMQEVLGIDSVLTGFGLPDDRIHSPNEKLDLPTWRKGVHALIHFFLNVQEQQ
ncbi:MAG: dipeptidase [Anaerolineaceae bacterium]|jgi:acetylornithine deacetylase/succinyl-diaminopimelate desuccinylase-like protein